MFEHHISRPSITHVSFIILASMQPGNIALDEETCLLSACSTLFLLLLCHLHIVFRYVLE
jgi:hypothetical protein